MKIKVVIVSSDSRVVDYFEKRSEAAIPQTLRSSPRRNSKNVYDFSISVFDPRKGDSLIDFVASTSERYDGVVCLVESSDYKLVSECGNSLFVCYFSLSFQIRSVQNYFSHVLNNFLRKFIFYLEEFVNGRNKQVFLLPVNSFQSPELKQFNAFMREEVNCADFKRRIQIFLSHMSSRKTPKRKEQNPKYKYFRDDCRYFFQYGHEEHSIAEDGSDHLTSCKLEKFFKFGARIGDNRHYNLSKEKNTSQVCDIFFSCHGKAKIKYGPRSHLNVFPNGFIT